VIGAGGSVLQWSLASAAAVPAVTSRIGGDDGGATTEADAGGEPGDVASEEAGADGDSETTLDESAALRP